MASLSLGKALAAMAQSMSGYKAGQVAAEQEQRRRQMEQEAKQAQHDALMLSMADKFAKDQQARILSQGLQNSFNRAQGLPYGTPVPGSPTVPATAGPFSGVTPAREMPTERPAPVEGTEQQGPAAPVAPFGPLMSMPLMIPGMGGALSMPFAPAIGSPQVPRQAPSPAKVVAPAPATIPATGTPTRPPVDPYAVQVPGVGAMSLRTVDPKEAANVLKGIGETEKRVFSQAFVKDPNTMASLRSIVARKPTKPVDKWTEEDFAQAKAVDADLNSAVMFLGKQNPQIQMDLDRAEVSQIDKDLGKLSGYRPDNLQTELIRLKGRVRGLMERGMVQVPSLLMAQMDDIELMEQAIAKGDKPGAGLILGLIKQELTPKAKDADPIAAYDKLLLQAPRWAGVAPEAQQMFIRRARQAAQDAGLDPSAIPDKIDALMSEESRKRLGISSGQLKLAQEREKRLASEQTWRRNFDTNKEKQRAKIDAGNLTEAEHKRIGKLEAARDAQYQRRNKILEMAPVDLAPGKENAATAGIKRIDAEIERLNGAIDGIIGGSEKRSSAAGAGGGKAATGGLLGELADPNRPENKAAKAGGSYTAAQLRSMPSAQRQAILKKIPVAERMRMLGEIAGNR